MSKKSILYFFVLVQLSLTSLAQGNNNRIILPQNFNTDSLNAVYGQHKKFIPEFRLQTLVALSYYPELKDVRIVFKEKSITTTGKTTLTPVSFFFNHNRQYIVCINNRAKGRIPLLKDVPFNAQVGLISHELAHVADFVKKRRSSLLAFAYGYVLKNERPVCEKSTDRLTIEHGAGWQLYDWMDFVMNHAVSTDAYRNFKRKNYLSTEEIAQLISSEQATVLGHSEKK